MLVKKKEDFFIHIQNGGRESAEKGKDRKKDAKKKRE
jgi:hypothetical protein